ncbi:MAG: NUDIX domain-containing protein [Phycisphaerales bacterium]|nr:NUDIX domain-containing protein [Phycisphaerales bacterium]
MSNEPRYCCAILMDSRGRYVFERRPQNEADAPGMLTCFGGGREEREDAESCLRRELREELGFVAGELERVFTLRTPRGEAWFYRLAGGETGPEEGTVRALEAGFEVVWVDSASELLKEVGAWHRVVLDGLARGEHQATVA